MTPDADLGPRVWSHGLKQEIGGKFIGLEGVQEELWVLGKAFRVTSGKGRKQ